MNMKNKKCKKLQKYIIFKNNNNTIYMTDNEQHWL